MPEPAVARSGWGRKGVLGLDASQPPWHRVGWAATWRSWDCMHAVGGQGREDVSHVAPRYSWTARSSDGNARDLALKAPAPREFRARLT